MNPARRAARGRRRRPRADRRRPVGVGSRLAQAPPRPRAGGGAARRRPPKSPRSSRPAPPTASRIVTQGGNTGLVGGSVPDASGTQVLLSLTRMNRIRAIDAANLTMTVDAGCVLQAVQEAAAARGLLFPLSLAAEGSCTIGGNLATNAGGTQVLRYGNARELCLGLEVVTAAGEVWDGPERPAQGQHRLRPARPVHRQRRHAGRDHRRDAEALPAAGGGDHRARDRDHARRDDRAAAARAGAPRPGPDRIRADEPVRARPGAPAVSGAAPAAAGGAVDRAAGAVRRRRRRTRRGAVRSAARDRARARPGHRCGGRREPRAVEGDVAPARIDPDGAERRRREHQARHLAAGVGDRRVRRLDRRRAAAGVPRRPAGRLRPSRRRQPALQRAGARRRRTGRIPRRIRRPDQRAGVRRGRGARRIVLGRARDRRSSSATRWPSASRRSRCR